MESNSKITDSGEPSQSDDLNAQPLFRKLKKKPKLIRSLKPEDGDVEEDELT